MIAMKGKGGNWTEKKLSAVRKYLPAYLNVLKNKPYSTIYIDGFAGSGDRQLASLPLLDELNDASIAKFSKGSTRLALECDPHFDKYVFIEKAKKNFQYLQQLKADFSDRDISLYNCDANKKIKEICTQWNKNKYRAVLFLDPYASEVEWETLTAVANTKGIDVWILYPLMAVNRMLPNSGNFSKGWKERLDLLFGTSNWYEYFYSEESNQKNLFDSMEEDNHRNVNWDRLEDYYKQRLMTIFEGGVCKRPLRLNNTSNRPIFSLFFCCGNPYAKETALKIANHILKA